MSEARQVESSTPGSQQPPQRPPTSLPERKPAKDSPSSGGPGGLKKKVVCSPTLEKVPEGSGPHGASASFGVKSYLHNFYEHGFRDPAVYEEDGDDRYLLRPSQRRRFRCAARWWKGFLCVGVVLLLVGLVAIMVGYISPQRDPVIGHQGSLEIIDRKVIVYNYNLEIAKVAGLVTFCCGGVALTVSLLFPSFFHQCCDPGDSVADDSFIASLQASEARRSLTPEDGLPIPVTSSYDAVQPGDTAEALKGVTKLQ